MGKTEEVPHTATNEKLYKVEEKKVILNQMEKNFSQYDNKTMKAGLLKTVSRRS